MLLKTKYDLDNAREQYGKLVDKQARKVLVCAGTGCVAGGSLNIYQKLIETISAKGLECVVALADEPHDDDIHEGAIGVKRSGCHGFCEMGPLVRIEPEGWLYTKVKLDDVDEIVDKTICNGECVERLCYKKNGEIYRQQSEIPFYKMQQRIVLEHCGHIDATSIKEYLAIGGYRAFEKALLNMSPEDILNEMTESNLRGRGGGGFPLGRKWTSVAKQKSPTKYIVCNGDEGDPGAFMDRSIMEGDPHSIVEAMALCGYSIGSSKGLVYIRAEYPLAIQRLKTAIAQAREYGLLGDNIFGTGFCFDIEIRYGAGAFVCGEETALIHSMEGKRGEPTLKPPFPAESGYLGKPTNVNNVETLANIPIILTRGAEWFSTIGTEFSKGTKVFALAGKINNVGLIEVPMGTTLREVIYEIGGGIKGGKKFKAVQTGGPSGGCLTEKHLDTPIDFDNLLAEGSMMGSGGMIVMDEDDCMVSVARFYLDFTVEESCGKCTPCRIGNKRLLEILNKITEGRGSEKDLQTLSTLGQVIKDTALCGLGQTSPNPVLSTLNNFYDEYVKHVREKTCRARQCKSLLTYTINPELCIGCHLCFKHCPADAILGDVRKPHVINPDKCIKCGMCMARCKFKAISVC